MIFLLKELGCVSRNRVQNLQSLNRYCLYQELPKNVQRWGKKADGALCASVLHKLLRACCFFRNS
jgi:hypothetical protein